ncbi:MAG: binding-protein-dependent transport system inner rane component [Paenibacillaceae bacterium]|nr:binding-protein-dependent transport system inner rane component [Paenibacillaceae bacterium]
MSARNGSRTATFIIYSIVILLSLTCLFPFIHMLAVSLSDQQSIITMKVSVLPRGFQTLSYQTILQDPNFFRSFSNTVYVTLVGTAINLAMTIITAYPLIKRKVKIRSLVMKLIVFTMLFHGGTIPAYLLMRELGLVNSLWALILPGAISTFNLIIMRTFFMGIPKELEEAAIIDGCNELQILLKIYIPLSLAVIATLGLFYAVAHWNSYMNALIYLNDVKLYTLQVKLKQLLIDDQIGQSAGMDADTRSTVVQESLKAAVIIVSTLPILVVYPWIQKYFVKGVMIGAIKG